MQRLQLTAFGEPSQVTSHQTTSPPTPGTGEVLVQMEAAPINRSDFMLIWGNYGVRPDFPYNLGSEGVGRVLRVGEGVKAGLEGTRVLILPTYESGTWADEVVVERHNLVPVSNKADPLQLAMIGINPATAYLLLKQFTSLMPGDWIGQTAANAAMGQYIIQFAKLAGLKTLNVVRRSEAAEQVRQFGGDRVVIQGENLAADIEGALEGQKLSLVLDTVGGSPVGELAKFLKSGGPIVGYGLQSGEFPKIAPADIYFRNLRLHGFWLINWIRNAPRHEVQETYKQLARLVAEGVLSAAIDTTYPLDRYQEAFAHAIQPHRSGKVLFQF